jgi:hypothetical protein
MADPKEQLARAVEVVRQQMTEITRLRAEVAEQKEHIIELEKALVEQFGAHGILICQYTNPKLSAQDRRKASLGAIPYEKARLTAPQEHSHAFHLFAHLEAARLAKRQGKVIDAKPIDPPAA